MKVACICPTYGRPHLVPSTIWLFQAQKNTGFDLRLFILDDANQFDSQVHTNWELLVRRDRFPSLGAKINALVRQAVDWGAEIICMWDDDDIYLSEHVQNHVLEILETNTQWSVPRTKYFLSGGTELKKAYHDVPYCHGSWAYRTEAWRAIRGYSEEGITDFDYDFARRLREHFGSPCDPTKDREAQFVYRWYSPGHQNFSGLYGTTTNPYTAMSGQGDHIPRHGIPINPTLDAEARKVVSVIEAGSLSDSEVILIYLSST